MSLLNRNELVTKYFCFFISIIILMFPALYNGYPLVSSDSGTYIGSGFQGWVPLDRPIFYGLFVKFTSFKSSLWFTIITQAIIANFLIWQLLKLLFKNTLPYYFYPLIIALLVSFSSLGWFVAQIMPDIFISLGAIAFVLLLFGNQPKVLSVLNSIILMISILCHNSHLISFTLLFVLLFIFLHFKKHNLKFSFAQKNFSHLAIIIGACWLLNPLVNYFYTSNFEMQGSPHAFLIGKNIESGTMDKYLKKNCIINYNTPLVKEGTYYIYNVSSNKFIDVAGYNLKAGGIIHQWEYTGADNQKFIIRKSDSAWVNIISANSLKFLTLKITTEGQLVLTQEDSTGSPNQLFKLKFDQNNFISILNKQTNKYIIADNNQSNGSNYTTSEHINNLSLFAVVSGANCLCYFKDSLPNTAIGFLWDSKSILYRSGDWIQSKRNYKKIISDIYFSPEYIASNIGDALIATGGQLMHNNLGEGLYNYDKESSPYCSLIKNLPYECKPFLNSMQNRSRLDFRRINDHNFLAIIISILIIFVFLFNTTIRQSLSSQLILMSICFVLIQVVNAFTTGALANVLDRLQARVIWLIPFCALILLLNHFKNHLSIIISKKEALKNEC